MNSYYVRAKYRLTKYIFLTCNLAVFKYQKGNDSVLVVGEDDYNKCNKKNPIHTLTDGYSKFKLTRSGPFFFISGHGQRCENGQKLTTVVPSNHHSPSSTAPSPSPSAKTPSHAPPLHQPSHSPSPKDSPPLPHSPSPITPTHAPPPSHTPSPSSHKLAPPLPHSPSPAPSVITPTHAPPPSHAPAHAPPPAAPVSHHSPPQTDADQSISRPPHHAPAPAPSSASLVLTRGLGVVATIVCAMIVV